jgi:hypothetical protein
MNIAHHLSQLLYRYQCVSVPGFGAFLTETISAKIQESNQTFYPPRKVISFNPHLKNNDGFLASHIATAEKVTYDNAVIAIEKEILTWNNLLQNNESLILKNIGDLRQNSEGNLVFNPANHFNHLTNSFGLSSFVSPVVKREVFKQLEVVQEEEVVAPVYHEDEYEPRRYINPYLKYAAILLVSIGGGAFGYSAYISNIEQKETLMVQAEVQKAVETKIQEATFFIQSPLAVPTEEVVEAPKAMGFHIMAGAFRSEANANKELRNLTKKGYQARILNKNKSNLYPVIYGSFSTYNEAQLKMNEIQKSINKEAWILIEEQ